MQNATPQRQEFCYQAISPNQIKGAGTELAFNFLSVPVTFAIKTCKQRWQRSQKVARHVLSELRIRHVLPQLLHDGREIATAGKVVMPESLDHLLEHRGLRVLVHNSWDGWTFMIGSDHQNDITFGHVREGIRPGENKAHQHPERVHIAFFLLFSGNPHAGSAVICLRRNIAHGAWQQEMQDARMGCKDREIPERHTTSLL